MVLLNLLVKPMYIFGVDLQVQNAVGNVDYGLFSSLLNLSIIFNILLDLGITNYNNKSVAAQPDKLTIYLPNMLIAKGLLSLLFVGLLIIIGLLMDYDPRRFRFLFLIGCIQVLNSLLLFLRSNISANHDFKIDSVLSVLDRLLMILICGVLLLSPALRTNFKIEWFIYALLVSYGISILIAFTVIVLRYARWEFKSFDRKQLAAIIKSSRPYAILILFMAIYMRSDQFILANFFIEDGEYQNGIYVTAFRILDALNMFGFLFAGMLLPMFSRLIEQKNKVSELVKITSNILLPISLVIAANALFFKEDIMNFLYNDNTVAASMMYGIVIFSFPAYCIMNIYSTLLTANGSLKSLILISAIACILSIGCNLYFIPNYKSMAVAWVGLGVQWFAAIAYIIYGISQTDIKINIPWFLQFVFFFLVFGVVNFVFKSLSLNVILSIVLNIILFVPLVFLIKLWNWQDLTKYFQEIVVKDNK